MPLQQINTLAANRTPFLFIMDFDLQKPIIYPLSEIDNTQIFYYLNGQTNFQRSAMLKKAVRLEKSPILFEKYKTAFDEVHREFVKGNTFLLNLTFPTPIKINISLHEIFAFSQAKYKLYYQNKFVVFSPESFVKIKGNKISSFPMKGTIDANIPNARSVILADSKEHAEHLTIVDLIRNDLSIVAKNVRVEKFRYIDKINALGKNLLQVSSKISGELPMNWQNNLGDILQKLLPAGSISGAPKPKTVDIIRRVEGYERGYFTGIFGIFDGENLDSAVMIRFIENIDNGLVFKSGGGLTVYSNAKSEYNELMEKIYVPIS